MISKVLGNFPVRLKGQSAPGHTPRKHTYTVTIQRGCCMTGVLSHQAMLPNLPEGTVANFQVVAGLLLLLLITR